jgi:hypothetical protein
MKKLFVSFFACFLATTVFASWKPDDQAAVFSVKPDRVLGSPYFKEVLNTYGLLGFGYTMVMNDHHLVDLQKEMGVQIEEASEVSLVVRNFLETVVDLPVSTSGNYQALQNSSLIFILRTKGEVSPDTFFEKFDRWASGPAFCKSDIDRFRKDGRIEPDKIDEMSRSIRVEKKHYAEMEKPEKVGKVTLFSIPVSGINQALQTSAVDGIKMTLGMQAENDATLFLLGTRKDVLGFFEHESADNQSSHDSENTEFASFSIPLDGELLKKMETSNLSDPNGPLGPLATALGQAMYQIKEISGTAKFSGGRAHLDLTITCKDAQSAQSIWSVGQASLGMAQLQMMRKQLKNPAAQTAVSSDFLNRIKLKHQEAEVLVHVEASPGELMPWAANQKIP